MFSRALLLLLLCISTAFAATIIQASVDGVFEDNGSVLPEAQPEENLDPQVNEEPQEEHVMKEDVPETPLETQRATEEAEDDYEWGLGSLRGGLQSVNGYFDSILELMGGRDGVCQYRCRYGKAPQPRVGYQMPEPDGCSTSLLGFQFDMGVPAMTKCCNQLDICYDTCGSNKYRCDTKFRWCLHSICGDLKKSLGLLSKVEACESFADTMYNTVWTLGCRPFMNSQRAACYCEGEERDEL
ncbi:hypothetical protein DNTS_018614 [Danionella cerebrum]|uniref:Phospholipase A2 domain-containing protein n=1 Tax=Danionella cerebrum TaxID=2873325 RepID=A0A553QK15_9TELE|nr:hypothetical protein DNTS_018614 [Danionella translucida]TRY90311.1 hypothetical protein DNTS_018614 [Danionella translucida]